jgi:hypothetical protein
MSQKVFPTRLAGLLVAFVLVAGAWSAAQARIHPLNGSARFQIRDGLPMPIGFTAVPDGKVAAIAGATIRLHGHHLPTMPARVVIDPFQMTFDGPPINLPAFPIIFEVFQIKTDLTLLWPKQKVSFRALGRTGPPIVTFCGKPPSTTIITGGANPACAGGPAGTGLLRYTATLHQFGGPAQGLVGGVADVARPFVVGAPCTGPPLCVVAFFNATPPPTQAVGAAFGFTNMTVPTAPSPGLFFGTVDAAGKVSALMTAIGPGLTNGGTSWGGPWTTGMLTASAPMAVPPEKFTLTGADNRTTVPSSKNAGYSNEGGQGNLSLVAGGFSQRAISGPNANRGWLNLVVGPKISHIPTLPLYGMAALVGLTGLSGAYALRRRRNQ